MYTLREQIGEERVNTALRRYLEKHRDAGPPYPTSRDLYAELRAVTPDSLQSLLDGPLRDGHALGSQDRAGGGGADRHRRVPRDDSTSSRRRCGPTASARRPRCRWTTWSRSASSRPARRRPRRAALSAAAPHQQRQADDPHHRSAGAWPRRHRSLPQADRPPGRRQRRRGGNRRDEIPPEPVDEPFHRASLQFCSGPTKSGICSRYTAKIARNQPELRRRDDCSLLERGANQPRGEARGGRVHRVQDNHPRQVDHVGNGGVRARRHRCDGLLRRVHSGVPRGKPRALRTRHIRRDCRKVQFERRSGVEANRAPGRTGPGAQAPDRHHHRFPHSRRAGAAHHDRLAGGLGYRVPLPVRRAERLLRTRLRVRGTVDASPCRTAGECPSGRG